MILLWEKVNKFYLFIIPMLFPSLPFILPRHSWKVLHFTYSLQGVVSLLWISLAFLQFFSCFLEQHKVWMHNGRLQFIFYLSYLVSYLCYQMLLNSCLMFLLESLIITQIFSFPAAHSKNLWSWDCFNLYAFIFVYLYFVFSDILLEGLSAVIHNWLLGILFWIT